MTKQYLRRLLDDDGLAVFAEMTVEQTSRFAGREFLAVVRARIEHESLARILHKERARDIRRDDMIAAEHGTCTRRRREEWQQLVVSALHRSQHQPGAFGKNR